MAQFTTGEHVVRRTNGQAVASLVLGILGITGPLFLIGPILALVFGYLGKGQIDRSDGREEGRGLAVAGIVLGWVGVGLTVLFLAFALTLYVFNANSLHGLPWHEVHTVRQVVVHR